MRRCRGSSQGDPDRRATGSRPRSEAPLSLAGRGGGWGSWQCAPPSTPPPPPPPPRGGGQTGPPPPPPPPFRGGGSSLTHLAPPLRHRPRTPRRRRAIAAAIPHAMRQVDIVAAKPSLGQHRRHVGCERARPLARRINHHAGEPRRQR